MRRDAREARAPEGRVPSHAGTQVVIDTQRLYHAVWHRGVVPRYCLITSYESGPELDSWISARNPVTSIESPHLDPQVISSGNESAISKRVARETASASMDSGMDSGMEVLSEA